MHGGTNHYLLILNFDDTVCPCKCPVEKYENNHFRTPLVLSVLCGSVFCCQQAMREFHARKLCKVIHLQNVGGSYLSHFWRSNVVFYKAHFRIINKSRHRKPFFKKKTLLVFKSLRTTQTLLHVFCQGFISCLKRIRNCQLPNSEEQQHGH